MLLTWVCRNCNRQMARLVAREKDPRLVALTAQAGDDIIEYDRAGDMVIRILCEDCLDKLNRQEENDIHILQEPDFH